MAVYQLGKRIAFPDPSNAETDGLLAVGGDLCEQRILAAYSLGIFPWFSEGEPILWWSPDPRMILLPNEFHVSKRLARLNRKGRFRVTLDTAFEEVIAQCSRTTRRGQDGTWITQEMTRAYLALHRSGYAHSVECWEEDDLVGGLYGISLGAGFFGESMFTHVPNASKVALSALVERLVRWGFSLIDCQMPTEHLASLGAKEVPRQVFLGLLAESLKAPTRIGNWAFE